MSYILVKRTTIKYLYVTIMTVLTLPDFLLFLLTFLSFYFVLPSKESYLIKVEGMYVVTNNSYLVNVMSMSL